MQYELVKLEVETEKGYGGAVGFEGRPLGVATDGTIGFGIGEHAVEVYQVKDGGYLTYVFYSDRGGLQLAELVRTDELNFHAIRSALKESGIYPGPHFSRAVYHSLDTLQFLEKVSK